ncbi:casein kinase i isoform delta-like protein [Stylonychia lemnae]|uniref:Casein kinase I n=1 Tax=Stylonychia lemnae TaxID=5949 RepID=A0A078B5M1_STYLE|nr:casein kinase i isoform delta-like protein [Stylonychia lemnae]|eukprot:CDW89820.1 casein kinase i isoform delta-like protein [Stylonychia lemnae]
MIYSEQKLDNRFQLIKEIGVGAQGKVYEALDTQTDLKCAIKIVLHPQLIVYNIIKIIKQLHQIGYVHLDLKPDNIMLYSSDLSSPESSLVALIDFSVSQRYMDQNSNHLPNEIKREFNGNIAFSSVYQMNGHSPSRRDDLLSIFYLLLFLKEGQLPWSKHLNKQKKGYAFIQVQKEKGFIKNLIKYCNNLNFEEEPDYNYIIQYMNQKINNLMFQTYWNMDWSNVTKDWICQYSFYEYKFKEMIKPQQYQNQCTKQNKQFRTNLNQSSQLKKLQNISSSKEFLFLKAQNQLSTKEEKLQISNQQLLDSKKVSFENALNIPLKSQPNKDPKFQLLMRKELQQSMCQQQPRVNISPLSLNFEQQRSISPVNKNFKATSKPYSRFGDLFDENPVDCEISPLQHFQIKRNQRVTNQQYYKQKNQQDKLKILDSNVPIDQNIALQSLIYNRHLIGSFSQSKSPHKNTTLEKIEELKDSIEMDQFLSEDQKQKKIFNNKLGNEKIQIQRQNPWFRDFNSQYNINMQINRLEVNNIPIIEVQSQNLDQTIDESELQDDLINECIDDSIHERKWQYLKETEDEEGYSRFHENNLKLICSNILS